MRGLLLACTCVLGVSYGVSELKLTSAGAAVSPLPGMQEVPRSLWSRAVESANDATALASLQTPLVLTGSPVEEWVAAADWSPSGLEAIVPVMKNVYADRGSLFSYATKLEPLPAAASASAPFTSTLGNLAKELPQKGGTRLVNLTSADFFACAVRASKECQGLNLYYSGSLEGLSPELSERVDGRPFCARRPISEFCEMPNIWIGSSGVASSAHCKL